MSGSKGVKEEGRLVETGREGKTGKRKVNWWRLVEKEVGATPLCERNCTDPGPFKVGAYTILVYRLEKVKLIQATLQTFL